MVRILDCTMRDGGCVTNWNFEKDYVLELMKKLNNSGITYFEIGYRNHYDNTDKGPFYNCTKEILKEFYEQKGNLNLGVMVDTKRFSPEDFEDANRDYLDFVRVAAHPEELEKAFDVADYLIDRGYCVFIQLMDAINIDENGYLKIFAYTNKSKIKSFYIADSYGTILPEEVEKYYNKLRMLGCEQISFHGHNTKNLALENTLKLIDLGAYSIDVTQNGIGRNGGNLDCAVFFENFRK